jgi:hypothetical protein
MRSIIPPSTALGNFMAVLCSPSATPASRSQWPALNLFSHHAPHHRLQGLATLFHGSA